MRDLTHINFMILRIPSRLFQNTVSFISEHRLFRSRTPSHSFQNTVSFISEHRLFHLRAPSYPSQKTVSATQNTALNISE